MQHYGALRFANKQALLDALVASVGCEADVRVLGRELVHVDTPPIASPGALKVHYDRSL